jgi:hypothetical protein
MDPRIRTIGDKRFARLSEETRLRGGAVYSMCMSFAYAKNGNTHNPTPRLVWVATLDGVVVARGQKMREVREDLAEAMKAGAEGFVECYEDWLPR